MPLITLCGNPCTGKTTFANLLVAHLKAQGIENIELINEESLSLSKKECYVTSFNEKKVRGSIKGAVDHTLSADRYVIVDSLNYIKGFRYELFCSARSFRTPHCVVWVECATEVADERNNSDIAKAGNGTGTGAATGTAREAYDPAIMNDLRKRFEAPIDTNRWDHPLFKVNMGNDKGAATNTISVGANSTTQSVTTLFGSIKLDTTLAAAPAPAAPTADSVIPTAAATTTEEASASLFKPKSSWRPKRSKATDTAFTSSEDNSTKATAATTATTTADASAISVGGGDGSKSSSSSSSSIGADDKQLWFSGAMIKRSADLLDSFSTPEDAAAQIHTYFTSAAPSRQSASTVSRLNGSADALYELDIISKKVIQHIVAHQADNVVGTPIKFLEFDREIMLHRHTAQAELQRYRAQFIKMNGKTAPESSTIGAEFIDFLALHL